MTRMLSELLGAREPDFRLNIRQLERAGGGLSTDIRLSTEILGRVRGKLRELGLDPNSTTGEELYEALRQRLLNDESRLREELGTGQQASSPEVLSAVEKFFARLDVPRTGFALKLSVAKRLLKSQPPKKAMKGLGYRSIDSMLKHEPVAQIYAAAFIDESPHWQRSFMEQYARLSPSDFETRRIATHYPRSERWQALAEKFAEQQHHTSITFKELGSIVVVPVVTELPALALTSLLLLLEGLNDIRCASAFLKLQQVKPDFGRLVIGVATGEPLTMAHLAGQPLPWRVVQYYYAKPHGEHYPELFEPHVQPEDLQLARAEEALAGALPALEFWMGTDSLALVEDGQPVSLNMLDVALSTANRLPFGERIVHYVRDHVWRELLARYLNQDNLDNVVRELSDELAAAPPELATETEPVEV